ncbi:MAG TPA: decaprenyl-phosphate phosphoribosyltransferase [Alphaproteobacteria bacterium]
MTKPDALLRLMRPRQWVKNAFVGAPLFFTPPAWAPQPVAAVILTVLVFCLLSSAVYVINDYADREADRLHPVKCKRPIAAGEVAPGTALVLGGLLVAAAAAVALTLLPWAVTQFAVLYLALNLLYSFWLKHISLLDVLIVSAGFVLRVDAGAAAIDVDPTVWIVVCTGLLALFLALAKRRDDVAKVMSHDHRPSLAGYNLRFIDTALAMILGALLVSYLIYTTDSAVIARYGTDRLYLTAPFVIAGVLRYLQITLVEQRSGSPTDIALTDRFLIIAVLGWIIVFGALIYG